MLRTEPGRKDPQLPSSAKFFPKLAGKYPRIANFLDNPVFSYYLLAVTTLLLFIIGFLLVFSASTIAALDQGINPFKAFTKRAVIYVGALLVMFIASRLPKGFYRQGRWWFLGAAWAMQSLIFVPGLAAEAGGNTNWILIPGINMSLQPSEFIKLALAVFLGGLLAERDLREADWLEWLKALAVPVLVSLGLVLIGRDMGTAMVIAALVMVAIFAAGMRMRIYLAVILLGLFAATVGVMSSENRRRRVFGFMDASTTDPAGIGYQRQHGLWSLATGGLTGVGPGASREKWSYLPEADTDYIFAILGEEFGILGTFLVLILFGTMCLTLTRISRRSQDLFVVYTVAGVIGWFFSQALINIGAVVGLLPIIGVPLPLISSGGSSLLSVMAALGIALSFARCEPGAAEALRARGRPLRRSLAVLSGVRHGGQLK